MRKHHPKPTYNRPAVLRRIHRETDDDDRAWDDATLLVGGDDKTTASESGG